MVTNEELFRVATSSQEEAATNISKANLLNLDVDIYKEYSPVLDTYVERAKAPTKTTPVIDDYVNGSPEKAALIKPEVDKLSYLERQWKLLGDRVFDRPTATRRASELGRKKMFGDGKLTDDQELELMGLQEQTETTNDFGLDGYVEKLPAEVAGAVVDMGRGIKENAGLVSTAALTGAFIGAGTGAPAGGVGAIPGAIAGLGTGLAYGIPAAMAVDGANQMMGSMYNTLGNMMNDKGETITIPHQDKYLISAGVGITSGAITGLLGEKLVKTIPFLNKLMSPSAIKNQLTSSTGAKFLEAIKGIGKGFAAEGGEEALQETIQVVAEEFGKTYDGTEASYLNALWSAKERIAGAGVVGGLAGATITTGGIAISKPVDAAVTYIEKRVDPRQVPAEKAQAFRDTLNQIAKVKGEMKLKDIAPDEMSKIERKMLENAGFEHVYFHKEDLNKIAKSEEAAAKLMQMVDPTGQMAANINAEVQVSMPKFLETQAAFPELLDVVKQNPDAPNAVQADEYLAKRDEMRQQRQAVLDKIKAKSELTAEDIKVIENAQQGIEFDSSNLNENSYMKLDEAVVKVLGKDVVKGQLEARQNVSDQIQEAAQVEMQGLIDIQEEESTRIEYEQQRDRIKDDPDVAVVEKFANWHKTPAKELSLDKKTFKGLVIEDARTPHVKEGYSPLAIDPRLLSDDLKVLAKDKNLKAKKVFVQGGISPEKAATLLGFDTPRDLFEHLAETPTRAELVAQRVAQRAEINKANVQNSINLNDTSLLKNYRDKMTTARQELQYLLDQDWTTLKKGIKRIALPPPKVDSIISEANGVIRGSTVRDLNAKMWDRGAVRSKRLAVDAILKQHIENAAYQKENEIRNLAMAAETRKAFAQVNSVLKLIKQLKTKDFQETLNRAGKELYQDPVNQILEVFSFNKSGNAVVKANAYENYIKTMRERGEAPVVIPQEFLNAPTASYKDLTVDQMLAIGNTLRNISHMAEFKNKLMLERNLTETVNNLDAIGETLLDKAKNDVRYDENNNKQVLSSNQSVLENTKNYFMTMASKLERAESVIQKFDNAATGLLHNLIIKPIKDAEYNKINFMTDLSKEFNKHIDIYGRSDLEKASAQLITVPEFKDSKYFKNGQVTKAELIMMLANMGNDGNIKRLENYGVSFDTIKTVLERELDHRDATFVQNAIWNVFESFKPKIKEVHRQTEGIDPDFIEAKPLVFKGREYPGGYFKIFYDDVGTASISSKLIGSIEKKKLDSFSQHLYSQAMTKQGYLEERTGSEKVLSLSMLNIGRAMEEQVHDMFLRTAVRDTTRVLSHEKTSAAITGVLGVEAYHNIAEFVMAAGNEMEFKYASHTDNVLYKALNYVGQGFQTVAIVGKVSTAFIQPTSLLYTMNELGPKGSAILAKNFGLLKRDFRNIDAWYDLAEKIHPPIKASRENMDRDVSNAINQNLEKHKLYIKSNKAANIATNILTQARDFTNDVGFGVLGAVDNHMKVVTVISAYEHALNGGVDNIEAHNHEAAIEYARSIARTTLTTGAFTDVAPIQRSKLLKAITFFYNDASNVYNYYNRKYDKLKQDIKTAKVNYEDEGVTASVKPIASGVATVMGVIAMSAVSKMYQDFARNLPNPFTDEKKENWKDLAEYFASQSLDEVIGTVPVLRDVEFASGKTWQRKKSIDLPYNVILNDFGTSYSAVKDYLKNYVVSSPNAAITSSEKKAMIKSLGYIFRLPVDSFANTVAQLDKIETPKVFKGELFALHDTIEEVKKTSPDEQEFLKALDSLQENIGTNTSKDMSVFIPDNTYDVIKHAESNNKWFLKNPETSGFGLYQFTEEKWKTIMSEAPELNLTEEDRVSSDTSKQEKAAKWLVETNVSYMMANDIDPTVENIYTSFILDKEAAVKLAKASDNAKLKTLVDMNTLSLRKFDDKSKVKDFKQWVMDKINSNIQKVDNNK